MNRWEVLVNVGRRRRVLVTVYAQTRDEAIAKAVRLFAHATAEYVSIPMFG